MDDRELLREQAKFLGMSEEVYLGASVAERNVAKARHVRFLKGRLRKKGMGEEEIEVEVAKQMAEFPQQVRTNSAEIRARKKASKKVPKKVSKQVPNNTPKPSDDDDEEEPPYEQQGDVRVYHEGGTMPPTEPKERRDGPTVGPITELARPPDLVGDRAPRTLTDLYARWPLGDDPNFFLRVERTLPKTHHGVSVSGYIGDIREKISEATLQKMLGGREYKLTLYGPDPRLSSQREYNSEPRIKALTDPILLVVPVLPPVLNPLSGPKEERVAMSMNPFAPTAAPTSPADAQIHRANTNFFGDVLKLSREEDRRRQAETQQVTTNLLSYMTETQKAQHEQSVKEAERREEALQKQIAELKAQVSKEKDAQNTVAAQVAQVERENQKSFMSFVEKMGPDKAAEIDRLTKYYESQLDVMRRAFDDQLRSLRERHDSDLRRADERLKETESKYQHLLEQERGQSRTMLEGERAQWTRRESDLRTQMKEQTEAERNMASQRIADMKERHEEALRQMEKAHERELRTIKESSETRTTVTDQTHKMSLSQLEGRLEEAKEEVERLKQQLEEANDLPAQLEKMQQQAEILGYEKKDANEPKTAMERFAATAGAGLGQLMQNAGDWLPQMMEKRQQQQVRALPPGQRQVPPQQQQQQRAVPPSGDRRTPGAQWAAANVHVRPQRPEPMGFEPDVKPNHPTATSGEPMTTAAKRVVPAAAAPQNVTETAQKEIPVNGQSAPAQPLKIPQKFEEVFGVEGTLQLLQQAENSVRGQVDAYGFATLLVGQFPDAAEMLVKQFTVEEVVAAVEGIPGTEASPLLRRDGKKWLASLFSSAKKLLAERTAANSAESVPQTTS